MLDKIPSNLFSDIISITQRQDIGALRLINKEVLRNTKDTITNMNISLDYNRREASICANANFLAAELPKITRALKSLVINVVLHSNHDTVSFLYTITSLQNIGARIKCNVTTYSSFPLYHLRYKRDMYITLVLNRFMMNEMLILSRITNINEIQIGFCMMPPHCTYLNQYAHKSIKIKFACSSNDHHICACIAYKSLCRNFEDVCIIPPPGNMHTTTDLINQDIYSLVGMLPDHLHMNWWWLFML